MHALSLQCFSGNFFTWCMSYQKVIMLITERAHCFLFHICIALILLLQDLGTLNVIGHLNFHMERTCNTNEIILKYKEKKADGIDQTRVIGEVWNKVIKQTAGFMMMFSTGKDMFI